MMELCFEGNARSAIINEQFLSMCEFAQMYPRNVEQVREAVRCEAMTSPQIAEKCFYVVPRKNKQGATENIIGPSVRLAEIFLRHWKHLRVQSRLVEVGGDYLIAEAVIYDMENNVVIHKEVRRSIVGKDKNGKEYRYSADMINMTANAAMSIAMRNAVFTIIPRAIVDSVIEEIRMYLSKHPETKGKPLKERFNEAVIRFNNYGVSKELLMKFLQIKNEDEFNEEHLHILWGLYNSLEEGEITAKTIEEEVKNNENK